MTVMTSVIPRGRPFTVDDLEGFPDDGNRYELIDGMLLVSPAPNWPHQEMGATLYAQLRAACPNDRRVMIASFAVQTALEVLSRSTSLVDRNLKQAHYERIGVPYYWVLDPAGDGALTAFANEGGGYAQVARVAGDKPIVASQPFAVTIVPARLLDGLHPR